MNGESHRKGNTPVKYKIAKHHNKVLVELLRRFYRFLDKKPKPSNEEVRSEFRKHEMAWKMYCVNNNLGIKTSLLFNARVSYQWEHKYVRKGS